MRQKLEGMVNQIEAETADQGENGGQGRIPGCFCTLTCPVHKLEQLFEVALKSYLSGAVDDPNASNIACNGNQCLLAQTETLQCAKLSISYP